MFVSGGLLELRDIDDKIGKFGDLGPGFFFGDGI